jgi:tRNA dimethylallyltransferase
MQHTTFPIQKPIIVLVGPTAIGKTSLSLNLAEEFGCEIISLDSMQVYRYMDIGTAKASIAERQQVPHHLIDMVDPDEHYDANCYAHDALQALQDIHKRGKIPLITGGTGLYLRAVTHGLFSGEAHDPKIRHQLQQQLTSHGSSKLHEQLALIDHNMASKIHHNDSHRLIRALEIYHSTGKNWSEHIAEQVHCKDGGQRFTKILQIGLTCDRDLLYKRINARTQQMLQSGLKEEVRMLLGKGYARELKPMQSIGYRHIINHLENQWSAEETERILARDTRRYAKRQYTWFKKMTIDWMSVARPQAIQKKIAHFLSLENV